MSQYYDWKPLLSYPSKFALYWLEWLRYNAVIMRGPDLSCYITMLWLKASFILSIKICTVLTRVVTLQCCVHEGPRLELLHHNAMIESLLYLIHQICTVLTRVVTLQCCDHEGPRLEPIHHNAMIESLLYPIHQICTVLAWDLRYNAVIMRRAQYSEHPSTIKPGLRHWWRLFKQRYWRGWICKHP